MVRLGPSQRGVEPQTVSERVAFGHAALESGFMGVDQYFISGPWPRRWGTVHVVEVSNLSVSRFSDQRLSHVHRTF